jgi:hypothetical protein
MATTRTYTGQTSLSFTAQALASVDGAGGETIPRILNAITWAAAGGTAPTLTGWLYAATVTCAAGDWLLAHATDPFQSMGDSAYAPGFTVASSKLKLLYIRNKDTANSITIARGAANGLPIFDAASDAVTLAPGDCLLLYKKAGTAALTTTSNDKITVAVSAGSPTCEVLAFYGD